MYFIINNEGKIVGESGSFAEAVEMAADFKDEFPDIDYAVVQSIWNTNMLREEADALSEVLVA